MKSNILFTPTEFSSKLNPGKYYEQPTKISPITSGYRPIKGGKQYEQFFGIAEDVDRVIIEDGEVEDTVELMKKVVWKYIGDTRKIAGYLKAASLKETCRNIWEFLFNHIKYKLDQKGLEQLLRPARS